ncbi:MAG: hypothetical protein GY679_03005 [Mycoplasma sp.]|nr:hypothetical protein [Mycoplasma sp.]
MKLSTLIFLIGGTAAGVYLQSEEGEESRKKLKKSLNNITPVLKDMVIKLDQVILDSKGIKTDEIRANIEKKVDKLKQSIAKLDSKKIASVTDNTIRETARKIRKLKSEVISEPMKSLENTKK